MDSLYLEHCYFQAIQRELADKQLVLQQSQEEPNDDSKELLARLQNELTETQRKLTEAQNSLTERDLEMLRLQVSMFSMVLKKASRKAVKIGR